MDFCTKSHKKNGISIFLGLAFLFLSSFYIISGFSGHSKNHFLHHVLGSSDGCAEGVRRIAEQGARCEFVRRNSDCWGKGYLNYLEIFYCSAPAVGYVVLLLWLVVLFYVLGNTTAEYFCPSVESLARVLKLSPTIAGTTLLPLGNGANDVFSSVISFTRSNDGNVGLNSVLGGAFFISCFVVGVVSISVSSRRIKVDGGSFFRDVVFFLFVLCCLLMIIVFGSITLWFALCFFCLYFLYIGVVFLMQLFSAAPKNEVVVVVVRQPLGDELEAMETPLLGYVDEEKGGLSGESNLKLSQNQESENSSSESYYYYLSLFRYILELPLSLPRKLTIPLVREDNWSKPFAAASATLAPVLVAALFTTQGENGDSTARIPVLLASLSIGLVLGVLALIYTKKSRPPKRFLLPWLAGSFLMSIIWTYIIVEELVSLLVAFGNILGVSSSILGLTVLAWGNSTGDLISNLAMALRGGADGAQVAVSGCYAGPLFNTLVGLGLSFVFAAWREYPSDFSIPKESDLYETVGFLMGGLLWALVILPKKNMQLDRSLGIGLLAIYFCFLFLRLVKGVGLLEAGGQ